MRVMMFVFALLSAVGAFAQEQIPSATTTETAPQSAAEIRRAASERLKQQKEIALTRGRDDGVVIIVIYPAEKQMQAYRGTRECFVGRMPVEDIYVNPSGYLTVITRARKVTGCSDSRMNIDPIEGVVGDYAYNVDTKEQAKSSWRLYLQRPRSD